MPTLSTNSSVLSLYGKIPMCKSLNMQYIESWHPFFQDNYKTSPSRVFWLLPLLMLFESPLNNSMIDNLLSEVQIATRMPFAFSLEFKWEAKANCQTYKIKVLKYLWNNSTRLPRILICKTSCLSFQVLSTTSRALASENPWEFYIIFFWSCIREEKTFPSSCPKGK